MYMFPSFLAQAVRKHRLPTTQQQMYVCVYVHVCMCIYCRSETLSLNFFLGFLMFVCLILSLHVIDESILTVKISQSTVCKCVDVVVGVWVHQYMIFLAQVYMYFRWHHTILARY